jgi:uncharacterized membrane protein
MVRRVALLSAADEARIVAAIRRAEARTSGEIRVHVERRCRGDALAAARAAFDRLGLRGTARRNGVLFYVAVADRRFAVVGDDGIHRAVGEAFWEGIRDDLASRFRARDFAGGLEAAILAAGEALARTFPRGEDDRNELPDGVSY